MTRHNNQRSNFRVDQGELTRPARTIEPMGARWTPPSPEVLRFLRREIYFGIGFFPKARQPETTEHRSRCDAQKRWSHGPGLRPPGGATVPPDD